MHERLARAHQPSGVGHWVSATCDASPMLYEFILSTLQCLGMSRSCHPTHVNVEASCMQLLCKEAVGSKTMLKFQVIVSDLLHEHPADLPFFGLLQACLLVIFPAHVIHAIHEQRLHIMKQHRSKNRGETVGLFSMHVEFEKIEINTNTQSQCFLNKNKAEDVRLTLRTFVENPSKLLSESLEPLRATRKKWALVIKPPLQPQQTRSQGVPNKPIKNTAETISIIHY